MTEPHNNSKGHIESSTCKLTVKDVDTLLGLFRQLQDLLKPKLPPKNEKLWKQCQKEAKKEIVDQTKERESQITMRPGCPKVPPRKTSKAKQEKDQQYQKIILGIAEKKYRLMDSKYNQALLQVEEKRAGLVKEIDHTLYSIKEPLLKFDRAKGTLLEADWRQIRDNFSVNEIIQFQSQGLFERAIDALEAIRAKIEHRQKVELPEKPTEIDSQQGKFGFHSKRSE